MLTQLDTVKTRLGITDTQYDPILTNAITGFSGRFNLEANRVFERTIGATYAYRADLVELCLPCYPIEQITGFDLKTNEIEGWIPTTAEYLIRGQSILVLSDPIGKRTEQARITYTGGFLLPGTTVGPGQNPLPAEIEHALVEQVAFWFQQRAAVGVIRNWPTGGNYMQVADTDLILSVRAILRRYARWIL